MLALGLVYGAVLLRAAFRQREEVRRHRGSVPALAAMETGVFFCASTGISDFLIHTLLIKHFRLIDDEKRLPGTLVGCCLLPGAIFAWTLLRVENPVDLTTLIVCGVCVMAGALTGSRLVGRLRGEAVGRIMRLALIASLLVLMGKIILSAGRTGTALALSGGRLYAAAALCFISGAVNMFGIPMKPTWTATFLLLGLSPLAAVMAIGAGTLMGNHYNNSGFWVMGQFFHLNSKQSLKYVTLPCAVASVIAIVAIAIVNAVGLLG